MRMENPARTTDTNWRVDAVRSLLATIALMPPIDKQRALYLQSASDLKRYATQQERRLKRAFIFYLYKESANLQNSANTKRIQLHAFLTARFNTAEADRILNIRDQYFAEIQDTDERAIDGFYAHLTELVPDSVTEECIEAMREAWAVCSRICRR